MIDGQFVQVGPGYSPQLLEGLTHDQIRGELQKTDSSVGKAIRTEIDTISALICKVIGKKATCCDSEIVKNLISKI